jgi:hypothetical protein
MYSKMPVVLARRILLEGSRFEMTDGVRSENGGSSSFLRTGYNTLAVSRVEFSFKRVRARALGKYVPRGDLEF